ncbi:MAG: hypothetical protein JEZ09_03280 [Salinivirgaceae bacterium]|nr:hypothetical protein [Salinivirgaceae bacterium]
MDKILENFQQKINTFINKYYKNSFIKGIILTVTLFAGITLVISVLEYIAWFPTNIRFILFLFTILSFILIFAYFLAFPIFRMLGVFNRLTDFEAAKIIQKNIEGIDDTILNILELNRSSEYDHELVTASIVQKINDLEHFNFSTAVDFSKKKKFIKYFVAIVILSLLCGIVQPKIFTYGSARLINYNVEYIKEIGFNIDIRNDSLNVERGKDYLLNINITGDKIPSELYIKIASNSYITRKINNRRFTYLFKNVNQNFLFKIGSDNFISQNYELNVLVPPVIKSFIVFADYPDYTTLNNEEFVNESNLKVPIGTICRWSLEGMDVDSLFLCKDSTKFIFSRDNNLFEYETKCINSFSYSLLANNKELKKEYFANSKIIISPDLFPSIDVSFIQDQGDFNIFYFKGIISDDYGFSSLVFKSNTNKLNIPINYNINTQEFFFVYDFGSENIKEFEYYFEVFDNDNVNGFKSTKSEIFKYVLPTKNELLNYEKEKNDEILKFMEKSFLKTQEIKKDIENLKTKLLTEKLTNWEKNKIIEDIQQKHKSLSEILSELADKNNQKDKFLNSYDNVSEELIKKQKQIQDILEIVMDDQLRDLLKQLNELKNNLTENELNELSEKLDLKYDNLSKELDRNLELLQKLKIEKDIENIASKILDISKDQEKLSNAIIDSAAYELNKDNLEEIEDLQKKYDADFELNKALEKPLNLNDLEEDFENLENGIEESNDLENNNSKESHDDNSKKAKKLADKMMQMMQSNQEKENSENAESLRQILENLFYFSFNEELIVEEFATISNINPKYLELIREQKSIADNYSIIKDSLYALSRRTPLLGNHINEKVFYIEAKLFEINEKLEQGNNGSVRNMLRYSIEYSNDLILLLTESLQNMDSMEGGGGGSSSNKKKKPKKGKPSMSELRSTQQGLKEDLQNMINQMKNGGKQPSTSQMGKMLAKQEMFQQLLNDFNQKNGTGNEASKILEEINRLLEQNKRDLINFNINRNTLNRQNQITTRLLEAENAEKERDKDDKRKSNEALEYQNSNPKKLFEDNDQNSNFNDILNKSNIHLMYFYKIKYQEYINNVKSLPDE